jgi:hypothetical protein
MNLQDGVKAIFGWGRQSEGQQASHVVQIKRMESVGSRPTGHRYKAKANAVAYERPAVKKAG